MLSEVGKISLPREVVVKALATIATLGPDFDVFGMALEYPKDKVSITPMSDMVVEPSRAFLIPVYEKVRKYLLESGACGVAINGA